MLEAAVNTLLLATSNPHKVEEVAATLGPLAFFIPRLVVSFAEWSIAGGHWS